MQYDKLKSSPSFAQLRKKGSSYVAPAFVILIQKNNNTINKTNNQNTQKNSHNNALVTPVNADILNKTNIAENHVENNIDNNTPENINNTISIIKNNTQTNKVKIGFTASKKIGNAIKRALARRRLRAALQEITPNILDQLDNYELNIVARYKVLDMDFQKLVFHFNKTFDKLIQEEITKNAKKD